MGGAGVGVLDSMPIEQMGVCGGVNIICGNRREASVQAFEMREQFMLVRIAMHD